jgi:EAL domain-containing protein (putative c-di-GMP-specific phosphodiesterase class I)
VKRFELERAITENELVLHFQPIVDVPSRRLRGVEALVRWKHPERGIVSPIEFISEAETSGLIRKLTLWVLREALLHSSVWRRDGTPTAIGVNLSPVDIHDAGFRRFLTNTLKAAGGPEHLVAEVPARGLLVDPPIAMLELMRTMGVRVAIDDAGESDAHVLENAPADIVKVGRGVVSRLTKDYRMATFVRAFVTSAHERGLRATAVGVEDEATWDAVAGIGFDTVQGYLIAAPMPAQQLSEWRAARV